MMISQSYDVEANALYIKVSDEKVSSTAEVDNGTLVDLDAAGQVVGIEVIQPKRPWPLEEIIANFGLSSAVKRELRAYFPEAPQTNVPSPHVPSLRVAIA
jgi:uncharacterized protein YuzE